MKLEPVAVAEARDDRGMDCAVGVGIMLWLLFLTFGCGAIPALCGCEDDPAKELRRSVAGFGICSLAILLPASPILIRFALRAWRHSKRSRQLFEQPDVSATGSAAGGETLTIRCLQPVREPVAVESAELSLAFIQHYEWQTQDKDGEPDVIPKYDTDRLWIDTRTRLAQAALAAGEVIRFEETFVMPDEAPLREDADRKFQELSEQSYFHDAGPRYLFWRVHIRIVLEDGFVYQVAYKLVPDDAPEEPPRDDGLHDPGGQPGDTGPR